MIHSSCLLIALLGFTSLGSCAEPAEPSGPKWDYSPAQMRPFWQGDVMTGESVLFIRDTTGGKARASVLFPIREMLEIRSSAGDVVYQVGRDYTWKRGSREIVLPPGSRIVASTPGDLRRPADSQRHRLTHRDGNGEIMFGAKLEYHALQTSISYRRQPGEWAGPRPRFDETILPHVIGRLKRQQSLKILVMGDSISTGCNASGWASGEPFQPAYPELVRQHLAVHYGSRVELENLSISGKTTRSGATMCDQGIPGKPDLVIIAFGMNDSAGVSVADYRKNTAAMIAKIRKSLPQTEFILVATMLGNRDWPRLKQERFPEFRDALAELCEPGVALADLTTTWSEFLKRKKDWDLTGNGVNHPNDFGHRVYAQMICSLLTPAGSVSK
jgi:acyl-CoA thioesterase I